MYFGMCVHIQHGGQASTLTELLSFVFELARVNYPNTRLLHFPQPPTHTQRRQDSLYSAPALVLGSPIHERET